jgi:hypothetical protein
VHPCSPLVSRQRCSGTWRWLRSGVAGVLPLALGAHRPGLVPSGAYQGAFAKNKSGPRIPRPPRWSPGPGFLSAERGEGLPSTRNWPCFLPVRPLPPTSPPQPGDTQGNVSRQLAGAVVLGGGAAPAPPLAGSGRSCTSSIRLAKKNARCPARPSALRGCCPGHCRKGCPGWLGYAACSRKPGRARRSKAAASSRVFFIVIKEIAARRR